ncbi:uncharacterized protein LOC120149235 [Hibiscus syriacus]|uniref:uncharacterized protein LOC120149235 n=1 Tax=Hibiscus syriacus TaxID=106335 RepID=UPI0019226AD9|nr:uncharacterized protein LOC120149235 [Hibiscus syriacus]
MLWQMPLAELRALLAQLSLSSEGELLAELQVEPELVGASKRLQSSDGRIKARIKQVRQGEVPGFELHDWDVLYFKGQLFIPADTQLCSKILHDAHYSPFSVHQGSNKMYHELRQLHWWLVMKKEVSEFVVRRLVCQQVKVEHHVLSGSLHPIQIP